MNTTANDRLDGSIFGKLSARTRATIEALTKSPLAAQALASVEQESITRRKQLAADLARLEKAYPALKAAADQDAYLGGDAVTAAAATLEAACQKFRRLQNAGDVLAARHAQACHALTIELRTSADVRLAEFEFELRQLIGNDLVAALQVWIDTALSRPHNTVVESNLAQVVAAKAACQRAAIQARGLQLEPLGYTDVSQWLMRLCAEVAPALSLLEMNPPCLTAEHTEVGRPTTWGGSPVWVADEVGPNTIDARKARAANLATKLAKAA